MRVVHVSTFDSTYGAAIAARRISCAVNALGARSTMLVEKKTVADPFVDEFRTRRLFPNWMSSINGLLRKIQRPRIDGMYSPSVLPTFRSRELNQRADIVNLHWVNYDLISIDDIGRISRPVTWTLHDMWPFLGCEHYTEPKSEAYVYSSNSFGIDLTHWVRGRKVSSWRRKIHFIGPSRWIADSARLSPIGERHEIHVIPNPIDTNEWFPCNTQACRKRLGLDPDLPVVGFGAFRADLDPRKGGDLLEESLRRLHSTGVRFQALVFGNSGNAPSNRCYDAKYLGQLKGVDELRDAYGAMSVMVIPSRIDNLPNTGLEASACGVPIVAFDVGGLRDIIETEVSGLLAEPFDTQRLADHIRRFLVLTESESMEVSEKCRKYAVDKFGNEKVGKMYMDLYCQITDESKGHIHDGC